MSSWQPIETAPRDGTGVLAFLRHVSDTWIIDACWFHDGQWWVIDWLNHNDTVAIEPTHWMPLPEPPEDGE